MAVRKTRSRKAPVTSSEPQHVTNVLLEDIRAQQNVMFEAMTSWRDELRREFREGFAHVNRRLDILEAAVRQNSEDIKKNSEDIKKNSEDIRRLSQELDDLRVEVRRLRADFDGREELARIVLLEGRVTELERKLAAG